MKQFSLMVNGNEMSRVEDASAAYGALEAMKLEAEDDGRMLGEIPEEQRYPGHVDGFVAESKYNAPWNGNREAWAVVEWDDEEPRRVERAPTARDAAQWLAEQDDDRLDAILHDIRMNHPDSDEFDSHEDEDRLVAEDYAEEITAWLRSGGRIRSA